MKNLAWALLTGLLFQAPAFAMPAPAQDMAPVEPGQPRIAIRTEVRNLFGPNAPWVPEDELRERLEEMNHIFAQCSIRLEAVSITNLEAARFGITDQPRTMSDLTAIMKKLNPSGYPTLPITVAGHWNLVENGFRYEGLGWVFTKNGGGIDRMGAMVSNVRLKLENAAATLSHEVGHELSLPDTQDADSIMGKAGTNSFTRPQCAQMRSFALGALSSMLD